MVSGPSISLSESLDKSFLTQVGLSVGSDVSLIFAFKHEADIVPAAQRHRGA